MIHLRGIYIKPTIYQVIAAVGYALGTSAEGIISPKIRKELTKPRQIAMYYAREITHKSFPQLGAVFEKDHTSVLYAIRKVKNKLADEDEYYVNDVAIAGEELRRRGYVI